MEQGVAEEGSTRAGWVTLLLGCAQNYTDIVPLTPNEHLQLEDFLSIHLVVGSPLKFQLFLLEQAIQNTTKIAHGISKLRVCSMVRSEIFIHKIPTYVNVK